MNGADIGRPARFGRVHRSDGVGERLLRELDRAHREDEPPNFTLGHPGEWMKRIDQTYASGEVAVARHALIHLKKLEPELDWPKNVLKLIDLLPECTDEFSAPLDDDGGDVLTATRPGAETVIFCFCGQRRQMGVPLWLFHRWVSSYDASFVYVRDFSDAYYLAGVSSLGNRLETAAALRRMAHDLGARRVFCLGVSSGGYAAMHYGLELGAGRVANFGGPVSMEADFNTYLGRAESAAELQQRFPDVELDMRSAYLATPAPPATILVHGEGCWDDRLHHEHMLGLPGALCAPLRGYDGHGALPELVRRGHFWRFLDLLLGVVEPRPGDLEELCAEA